MLPELPSAFVMLSNLILTGPVTGHQHEMLWPRAAARYALEAFQQACALGEASWPGALDELTPEVIHHRWMPLKVRYGFECLGMQSELLEAIARELQRQRDLARGTGGAAIEPETYVGGEVDEILVEKALDALIALDIRYTFDPEGYVAAVKGEHWALVDQCKRILYIYGTQLMAQGESVLVKALIYWTRAGKYTCKPQAQRVVGAALNEAWGGLGGWRS